MEKSIDLMFWAFLILNKNNRLYCSRKYELGLKDEIKAVLGLDKRKKKKIQSPM